MVCVLCSERRARRGCPALGQQICPVCCGSKRLVRIQCPGDCVYLASSRQHPPSVALRQQQRDVSFVLQAMRDLNERQSELFLLASSFIRQYAPVDVHALLDDDVAEAAAALADTFETAARGIIYEHRPTSLPADRLAAALKPLLAEAGKGAGSVFERDAAVVLRRLETAAREARSADPSNRRAWLDLIGRVKDMEDTGAGHAQPEVSEPPRLIVP